MKNKKIGLIDCNNFYISVERVFNPESIGKPTVVLSNNDGAIISRSQEAKALGIKMGEPFFQKREFMEQNGFCVYSSNYNLYGDMSDRVMSVIKRFAKEVEVYSIDECFVDFSNIDDEDLIPTLHYIKDEVKRVVGIPVSIGVGPNKTLAKLTSHMAKQTSSYNGVCSYWELTSFKTMMYDIDLSEVWGIGRKWAKKFKSLEVYSVGQFVNLTDALIRKLTNVNGLRTKHELQGMYCHKVQVKPKQKKNIASTRSFGSDVQEFDQIAEAMYSYVESGIRKLKTNKLNASRCSIFVSGNIHKGQNHYKSIDIILQKPTQSVEEVWSQIYPHLQSIYSNLKKYKKCGIVFNNLANENIIQTTLFVDEIEFVKPPENKNKMWEMKQNFITKKYTTNWDEIPCVTN